MLSKTLKLNPSLSLIKQDETYNSQVLGLKLAHTTLN